MSSLPVLVFVPGAWHTPACFHKVIERLERLGYKCLSITLAAVGRNPPITSLDEDVSAIRTVVTNEVDAGNDVVMVMHSYGGVPANNSLKGLSKAERSKEGKNGGVIKLAMIAAFLIPEGASVQGDRKPVEWYIYDGDLIYVDKPEVRFYHDIDPDEAAYWSSQLQSFSSFALRTKTTYAAWRVIPVQYLLCTKDQALLPAHQEAFVAAAKEAGAQIEVDRWDTSHSPFLSKPDETAEWIRRVAGEIEIS